MQYPERRKLFDVISDYLKSNNCSLENLLGLKASLLAAEVAVENRIKKMVRMKDKAEKLYKEDKPEEYLD